MVSAVDTQNEDPDDYSKDLVIIAESICDDDESGVERNLEMVDHS